MPRGMEEHARCAGMRVDIDVVTNGHPPLLVRRCSYRTPAAMAVAQNKLGFLEAISLR
jgi:hypothetical protein